MANTGDVFSIPLGDGRVVIGQILLKKNRPGPCLIIVCGQTFSDSGLLSDEELRKCVSLEPLIIANSFDVLVDSGDWKKLSNSSPALDSCKLPAFRNGFMLGSHDGRRRFAWPWELFAPRNY